MNKLIFIFALLPTFPSFSDECNTHETLVASCTFPGKVGRVATFCANKNGDTIKYSFKKLGNVELVVNFNEKNKLKRWLDLGTYTTYFGFNQGHYSYVLGVPEESSGVVAFFDVKNNGKEISSKECISNSFGEKNIKNNSIEDVLDDSVRNNGFKFP